MNDRQSLSLGKHIPVYIPHTVGIWNLATFLRPWKSYTWGLLSTTHCRDLKLRNIFGPQKNYNLRPRCLPHIVGIWNSARFSSPWILKPRAPCYMSMEKCWNLKLHFLSHGISSYAFGPYRKSIPDYGFVSGLQTSGQNQKRDCGKFYLSQFSKNTVRGKISAARSPRRLRWTDKNITFIGDGEWGVLFGFSTQEPGSDFFLLFRLAERELVFLLDFMTACRPRWALASLSRLNSMALIMHSR